MPLSPAEPDAPIERGEPLREAVYARVVALISSGAYPPGAALTEASLSRSLRVSRTPVREALLRLEAEGVLESALARGFTVRPLVRREAEELYPILASLEGLAAESATPVAGAVLAELGDVLTELEACTDPVRRWRLDSRFHAAIADASGNAHLAGMIGRLRTNLSRYELTYMAEVSARHAADEEHRAVLAALRDDAPDRAAALLRAHWTSGMTLITAWIDSR